MSQLETAVVRAVRPLLVGLALSLPLLAVPAGWSRIGVFLAHLVVLVVFSLVLSLLLAPLVDGSWFGGTGWAPQLRRLAAGITVVLVVTGFTGLVTVASAGALRFQPSLQFLQLLSALDIAWVVAAVVVGLEAWRGRSVALLGGSAIGALCVASIWNYLRVVGLTPDGGWQLVGSELLRLVIPFDMMAAVVAGSVLVLGLRHAARSDQPMEQLSVQS